MLHCDNFKSQSISPAIWTTKRLATEINIKYRVHTKCFELSGTLKYATPVSRNIIALFTRIARRRY